MGSFKGHALPGSFFLVAGLWWTGKYSLWHVTRRNKNIGSSRLASRVLQRRLEMIESSVIVFFSFVGRLNLRKEKFGQIIVKNESIVFDVDNRLDSFLLESSPQHAA